MKTRQGLAPVANNKKAMDELDRQIARLNELSTSHLIRSVPKVAKATRELTDKQVASGVSPSGLPWRKTKKGEQALQGASAHIDISVVGTVIVVAVEGHHARHHLGAVKGKIQRRLIPTETIPTPLSNAIRQVVNAEFDAIMDAD